MYANYENEKTKQETNRTLKMNFTVGFSTLSMLYFCEEFKASMSSCGANIS